MGDFVALARAMVRDPALIVWLDGQRNTRQAPNENLARELMELFTLGIGAYGEADIKEAARALTGWRIDRVRGAAVFVPGRHATGAKTILGTTPTTTPRHWSTCSCASRRTRRSSPAACGTGSPPARRCRPTGEADGGGVRPGPRRRRDADARCSPTRPSWPPGVSWSSSRWSGRSVRCASSASTPACWPATRSGLRAMGQVPLRPPSVGGWPSGPAWLTTSSLQARLRVAAALAGALPDRTAALLATGDADAGSGRWRGCWPSTRGPTGPGGR